MFQLGFHLTLNQAGTLWVINYEDQTLEPIYKKYSLYKLHFDGQFTGRVLELLSCISKTKKPYTERALERLYAYAIPCAI